MKRVGASRHLTRGFTIVELLIVIVVIGILAALTIVAYNGVTSRAKIASMQSDLENSAKLLEVAKINSPTSTYPATLAAAGLPASNGDVLNYQVNDPTNPTSYCLTVVNNRVAYKITNTLTAPSSGACSGVMLDGSSCPTGYIVVPGNSAFGTNDFCVMKYEAKNNGSNVPISVAAGQPWVYISQTLAQGYIASGGCSGCHMMTEAEWMTIAANVASVASNWSGGAVGSGFIYSGHNDNAPAATLAADSNDANGYAGETNTGGNQRRTLTLTNGEVIWDFAGNVWEWTSATINGNQQPGLVGDSGYSIKEWNSGSLAMHGFPTVSRPGTISAQAATWSSSQGIGQLFSNYNDSTIRSYLRGGSYEDGALAGILGLDLFDSSGASVAQIGFRVTK